MSLKIAAHIVAFGLALWAGPSIASCTYPRNEPFPDAVIVLASHKGEILQRTTGADGTLSLRGLKRGEWSATLPGEKGSFKMQVARNGKLSIAATVRSYSCSPPGGPVHHSRIKSLTQLNKPK